MDKREIRDVTDIIEIEYLQRLQDTLGRVTGITTAVLNTEGIPVTRATNLYAFCEMMQASPSGVKMCMRTNGQLIEEGRRTRRAAIVTCPNSGLKTAAVPIFLGDKFLGSWLIGQMRTDDIDEKLIEQTAVEAGLSVQEAQENINRLPVMAEQEFDNILEFLETVIVEITKLVEMNDVLNEKNSELLAMTERLNLTANTFREFIDLSDVGVYVIDYETGEMIMFNRVYENLIGKDADALVGKTCFGELGYETWCPFCPHDQLVSKDGHIGKPVIWENYLPDMGIWLRISSRAIRWVDGRLALMMSFFDITDRKKREEEIEYIAYYDRKLKTPNGTKLYNDIVEYGAGNVYMIAFDIQGLRKVNDIYGRETGDALLVEIRNWIQAQDDYDQELYRIDGDGFVILVRQSDAKGVQQFSDRVFRRFDEAWIIQHGEVSQSIYVSVSMGIIPVNDSLSGHDELVNLIERILATARGAGAPIRYDDKMNKTFREHLQLEMSLKACVLNDMQGFTLHYQPIVEPGSGRWVGLEALCRWNSPELGIVPPDVFIPEAEQLGLIDLLGEWVLNKAVFDAKQWELDKKKQFMLAVNLSPIQLNDRELYRRVGAILKNHGFPADKLSLEITESAEVHFNEHITASLKKLRGLGLSMSLDDFGTGYASFSNLKSLPVNVIKTDRSFMQDIENDTYLQHTMRIMIEFAHAAGMKVTAEGVETEIQCNILVDNDADYIQGYFFSVPLPGEEIGRNLDCFA